LSENGNSKTIVDRFVDIAGKIAGITYLQVMKNAFMAVMPMFILAGFGTLLNSVLFPLFAEGEALTNLQTIGTLINNGTLNLSGVLITVMIAYHLSKVRDFHDPLSSVIVSASSLFVVLPLNIEAAVVGADQTATVTSAIAYDHIGTNGMFAGIIVAFIATEILIKLSSIDQLQINLGESIPPSVSKNFAVMIPIILTVTLFALLASGLSVFFDTNIIELIRTLIQAPLVNVGTSLWGFILIFSSGNFLFTLGIHHSVINSSILQPLLLVNLNENTAALAAGEEAPNIINETFRIIFGQPGGTGATLALLAAIFIFSKYEPYKQVAKLGAGPALFNINEPLIFGLPIVFNVPLMIPFVLSPIVGSLIGYFATWTGLIEPFSILVPWTTPPLLNGFLASGGDWMVIVVQLVSFVAQILLYIPFLRIAERVAKKEAVEEASEETTENATGEVAGENA